MRALITGCIGQGGIYLSGLLASKGYEVFGVDKDQAIDDEYAVDRTLHQFKPDEVYNLAGITNSVNSFENAREIFEVNTLGALNALEIGRRCGAKVFQASSAIQDSLSPYGISKLAAHKLTQMYREVHGVFAVSGVLHNYVSPLSKGSVINKICDYAKKPQGQLRLGNIHAKRDWMHTRDAVKAMWFTLQQEKPEDYEICTGITYSVREVVDIALGVNFEIEIEESQKKKSDIQKISGDPKKIFSIGWKPKTSLEDIVRELID